MIRRIFRRFYGRPSLPAKFVEMALFLLPVIVVVVGYSDVQRQYARRDRLRKQLEADTASCQEYAKRYRLARKALSDLRAGGHDPADGEIRSSGQ